MSNSNDSVLRQTINSLLSLNLGIEIEMGGAIYIRNHGDNEYVVGGVEEKKPYQVREWKESFDNIDSAIDYFITKRNQDRIGLDFWRFK